MLKNELFGACAVVSLAFGAAPAEASSADSGYASRILTTTDGRAYFEHDGTRSARPACATMTRWVIDTTTPTGQAMLANLLSAQARHAKIYLSGAGNCGLWADSEMATGIMTAD
jgi:hypothetical protein